MQLVQRGGERERRRDVDRHGLRSLRAAARRLGHFQLAHGHRAICGGHVDARRRCWRGVLPLLLLLLRRLCALQQLRRRDGYISRWRSCCCCCCWRGWPCRRRRCCCRRWLGVLHVGRCLRERGGQLRGRRGVLHLCGQHQRQAVRVEVHRAHRPPCFEHCRFGKKRQRGVVRVSKHTIECMAEAGTWAVSQISVQHPPCWLHARPPDAPITGSLPCAMYSHM